MGLAQFVLIFFGVFDTLFCFFLSGALYAYM